MSGLLLEMEIEGPQFLVIFNHYTLSKMEVTSKECPTDCEEKWNSHGMTFKYDRRRREETLGQMRMNGWRGGMRERDRLERGEVTSRYTFTSGYPTGKVILWALIERLTQGFLYNVFIKVLAVFLSHESEMTLVWSPVPAYQSDIIKDGLHSTNYHQHQHDHYEISATSWQSTHCGHCS